MSYRPERLDEIETEYCGVPVTVKGVTFYPYIPATQIDPPEQPAVEWESVWIGKIDVTEIFAGTYMYDRLQSTLVSRLEGA
jgi:hypothetical protein